jgi:hypothetical protein
VDVGQALVLVRVERRRGARGGCSPGRSWPRSSHDDLDRILEQSSVEYGVAVLPSAVRQVAQQSVDVGDLPLEQPALLQERDDALAVSGAQRRRPALVLLEQAGEALPARLGELELLAVAVEHLDLLELVAEQDVLELGLALDVAVLLSAGQRYSGGLAM